MISLFDNGRHIKLRDQSGGQSSQKSEVRIRDPAHPERYTGFLAGLSYKLVERVSMRGNFDHLPWRAGGRHSNTRDSSGQRRQEERLEESERDVGQRGMEPAEPGRRRRGRDGRRQGERP